MEYKKLEPINKKEVEEIFLTSNNVDLLPETLFRMVYHVDDPEFVEKNILIISKKNIYNQQVLTAISHFVRIHKFLPDSFKKIILESEQKTELLGYVRDVKSDIKIFLKRK